MEYIHWNIDNIISFEFCSLRREKRGAHMEMDTHRGVLLLSEINGSSPAGYFCPLLIYSKSSNTSSSNIS